LTSDEYFKSILARFLSLFVCLFVGIKPEKLYSASCWKGSKAPGSDHTRAEAPTCVPKTAAQTTYLSIYFKTLQVDRLARIPGLTPALYKTHPQPLASPHALFDVVVLDGGRGKTMNDLVDRDCKLPANKRDLTHVPDSGE